MYHGVGVAGAVVAAVSAMPVGDGWEPAAIGSSAADGTFHLAVPDGSYGVTATAAGRAGAFRGGIKVTHGKADAVELSLDGAAVELSGRAVDARGRPTAGATVAAARLSNDAGDLFFTRADGEGRYSVLVPPARYTVRVSTATLASEEVSVDPQKHASST